MALYTLFSKEHFWGTRTNEPKYDGYMDVGYWQQIDSNHPYTNCLGNAVAILEFDLKDLPRGLIIDSAILFVDHVSGSGSNPPDVDVYGFNRQSGNPSDYLEWPLNTLLKLSRSPTKNQDIILDITNFIRTSYINIGMDAIIPPTGPDPLWMGVNFVLGTSSAAQGFTLYNSGGTNPGGSLPSLWITAHHPWPWWFTFLRNLITAKWKRFLGNV